MHAIPLLEDETYYPDSDGEPVAEIPAHLEEMVYVWEVLDERFEDDPNVFVGANMFLFYRKGDPRGVVAPYGFVVKGVPGSYREIADNHGLRASTFPVDKVSYAF